MHRERKIQKIPLRKLLKVAQARPAVTNACVAVLICAGALLFLVPKVTDGLTQRQIEQREEIYRGIRGQVALSPLLDKRDEVEEAIATIEDPYRDMVLANLSRLKVVWLTLWDDVEQDGDVVMVKSGGYQTVVPIEHTPRRIAIPLSDTGRIDLVGVRDGGGGITVACSDRNGVMLPLPVLAEGQSIPLGVR